MAADDHLMTMFRRAITGQRKNQSIMKRAGTAVESQQDSMKTANIYFARRLHRQLGMGTRARS